MLDASEEELDEIPGVGGVIASAYVSYFKDPENVSELKRLFNELNIPKEEINKKELILAGMNFVITGSVRHFTNRNELKSLIESKGGKVTGSVTSKTKYLINNDTTSTSSKNKKANELGIPIISEEDFLQMLS